MFDYKVQLEVFEGPLDLLLYLVRKQEVDISQISIARLATDFIEHLKLMQELDLDVTGEFLVMAATLLYLKSRELLPVEQRIEEGEGEEEEDPRWEFIRRLLQYKRYRDASELLRRREAEQALVYPRRPLLPKEVGTDHPGELIQASLFDLVGALHRVLQRLRAREPLQLEEEEEWTVAGQMEFLLQELSHRDMVRFSELFFRLPSRIAVVVTFLALLELIRLRRVSAVQREPFGEIELRLIQDPVQVGDRMRRTGEISFEGSESKGRVEGSW